MQVFKGRVVGDHPGALTIDIMAPLFECDNDGQEFAVMCGIVAPVTSEFLAEVDHGLQATTLILQYGTTNAICGCISINSEVPTHVMYDQNRGSGECRAKGLEGLLLGGSPLPWYTGANKLVNGDAMWT